jgi:hypothetical protein
MWGHNNVIASLKETLYKYDIFYRDCSISLILYTRDNIIWFYRKQYMSMIYSVEIAVLIWNYVICDSIKH